MARGVLKSTNRVKRKGTTGKVEPSKQLLAEGKITFQMFISNVVSEHDMPSELIINFNQIPLSYISPEKYTFNIKGAKNVPVKGIDEKLQITATFVFSAVGDFLPMQGIYAGNTKRCLPNFDFPRDFNVSFKKKIWSNMEKAVEHFGKLISTFFQKTKGKHRLPQGVNIFSYHGHFQS